MNHVDRYRNDVLIYLWAARFLQQNYSDETVELIRFDPNGKEGSGTEKNMRYGFQLISKPSDLSEMKISIEVI